MVEYTHAPYTNLNTEELNTYLYCTVKKMMRELKGSNEMVINISNGFRLRGKLDDNHNLKIQLEMDPETKQLLETELEEDSWVW